MYVYCTLHTRIDMYVISEMYNATRMKHILILAQIIFNRHIKHFFLSHYTIKNNK